VINNEELKRKKERWLSLLNDILTSKYSESECKEILEEMRSQLTNYSVEQYREVDNRIDLSVKEKLKLQFEDLERE